MFYKTISYLKEINIKIFDFGGIDPINPLAEGVNHFKKGFGGTITEYLGEWEWSDSKLLRFGSNLGIWLRGGKE
jgi:lipid II:glycine glycyltransferase (peptidoglycan interpeptide bridge formation enzyme)